MAKKNSDLIKSLIDSETPSKKGNVSVAFAEPFVAISGGISQEQEKAYNKARSNQSELVKSVYNVLDGPGQSIERLAFEVNPNVNNLFQGLWRRKQRLLPNEILKRIAIQDNLVAAIVNARSNQLSAFGRPQPDRHSTGYRIEPDPGYTDGLSKEKKKELQDRIAKAEALFMTCGRTNGWEDDEVLSLSQFLFMSARNAIVFGQTSTEIIWVETENGKIPHSFRPIDSGTIYKAAPYKEAAQSVRDSALKLLEQVKNKKLVPEKYVNDAYTWVQVIDGTPKQAFTASECLVHNFYPVTDIELDGYPVTPLDTVITAVTTHINIGTHNKLYFQSGRAARGMIVIKSDDIDEKVTATIRQQFQANINNVGNSWRMPIFGVGSDDDIGWYPIDSSSRDMEFQYLSDSNAREILSAFQMSPEELPGYGHLSRGTNSQALSESNQEYKLSAARDTGIRPLMAQMQNFLNSRILPLIDAELAKYCHFKFVGLDAETAEKEAVRIQQDMAVHMTYNDVLEQVEKNPLPIEVGGDFPLNPQWQAVVDKYLMVGDILERFFGIQGASKDPKYQYVRDPFWFQFVQLQQQQQQMQMQQQQMQQQAQQQQAPQDQATGEKPQDLSRSIDQLSGLLSKAESQLPEGKKAVLAHQRKLVQDAIKSFEDDAKKTVKEITAAVSAHLPDSKKK